MIHRCALAVALFIAIGGPAWAGEPAKVTVILQASTTADGTPIAYPLTDKPEITAAIVEIPPGGETAMHKHPVPTFVYVMEGVVDVPTEGGETRHYKAGDAFLEVVNKIHKGVNKGDGPARALVIYIGEQGKTNMQPTQ